ncbi:MAG: hypothetical protein U1F66_10975 [bacterium]
MIFPLIFAVAVLAVGCTRHDNDNPPPQKSANSPPPPPPPPEPRNYRRLCLKDESCSWQERQAALLDYAGAVYGEPGKVSLGPKDGPFSLTPEEQSYVTEKFGRPEGAGQIFSFLDRSRNRFFKQLALPADPQCLREAPRAPQQLVHPQLGSALIVHGYHGCGKNYAEQLSKTGMELSIGAEPQEWAFFLESYGVLDQRVKLEETELFTRIAKTLDIPLRNALPVRALSKEALQAAAKASKYSELDFAVAVLFQAVLGNLRAHRGGDPVALADGLAPEVAKELSQDSRSLRTAFDQYLQKYPDPVEAAVESDRRAKILAETSNRLSLKQLRSEVQKLAAERPHLKSLFMVGSMHQDLIRQVYAAE